ncbi:chromate efflux transporter [Corallococcus exiguus]|uniref:Chromate efflux transporter n=1 Tax=Corallococcus exiguus TaxID=83462 RepID=A0A7X4Y7Y0_9BACT|nr:chromate efflux transporter [Corallococcus exiguus]NBC40416.1 chromate efflux transporter [Corallococcus exiguus]TNV55449.1 chromate efflux transporter [Corallococcus exiguus]
MDSPHSDDVTRGSLGEVARVFLRLGLTAFGGPAAHIAMMEDELVRRRRWLPREEFLDLLGATNLIPGPNSTELAIHLGHRRAGWPGLLVAGTCFIVPAMLLTLAAAWAYVRFGTLPQAGALLYGVKPVILAVVLQALWGLGKTALTTRPRIAVAAGSAVASALGVNELLILALAGGSLAAWNHFRSAPASRSALTLTPFALHGVTVMAATAAVPFSLGGLFLFFLKVGSVLFGSGYVLLAFLRADLVERWGWLTEAQLLDAVAVGQFTPGPVFTTATFIGYLVGGTPGAGLATLGIFLPAFVFVALSGPLVPRLRRSRTAGAVLDGVNAASLALMAVVTWQLGRAALVDGWTVVLAALGALLLLRWRVNSAWLVLSGAAAGLLRAWL